MTRCQGEALTGQDAGLNRQILDKRRHKLFVNYSRLKHGSGYSVSEARHLHLRGCRLQLAAGAGDITAANHAEAETAGEEGEDKLLPPFEGEGLQDKGSEGGLQGGGRRGGSNPLEPP